jgi:hypothetical protein
MPLCSTCKSFNFNRSTWRKEGYRYLKKLSYGRDESATCRLCNFFRGALGPQPRLEPAAHNLYMAVWWQNNVFTKDREPLNPISFEIDDERRDISLDKREFEFTVAVPDGKQAGSIVLSNMLHIRRSNAKIHRQPPCGCEFGILQSGKACG